MHSQLYSNENALKAGKSYSEIDNGRNVIEQWAEQALFVVRHTPRFAVQPPVRGGAGGWDMASKNIATVKGVVSAFNDRKDLDAIAKAYSDQAVLVDHARNETVKGRAAVKENWAMWATAFPDGKIEDARYVDGGDTIALYFVGHGKNDGTLGPLPATGKTISLPYCSVFTFDSDARVVEQDDYWDQLGFMVQLGHMPAPAK